MRRNAERSPAIVTALAPRIGYDAATKLVRQAEEKGVSLAELIDAHDGGTGSSQRVDALLAMARPYD
jgi:fumarate hydratase class II